MSRERPRRDWFVAVGDASGENEGNPLSFDASDVYGPFTAEQAAELSRLGDEFPHGSYEVRIFKVVKRKRFAGVRTMIRRLIQDAKAEAAESEAEQARIRDDRCGGCGCETPRS